MRLAAANTRQAPLSRKLYFAERAVLATRPENQNDTFRKAENMVQTASPIDAPNVYDAEPIPPEARAEIDRILQSGDLFRYTASDKAPVTL